MYAVYPDIILIALLPSHMAVWHFAWLDKLIKPWVAFAGGCGVSPGTYVRTLEAAPVGLMPPLLKALGSSCIEVKWMPPTRPNGIITSYVVHRWEVLIWGFVPSKGCRISCMVHMHRGQKGIHVLWSTCRWRLLETVTSPLVHCPIPGPTVTVTLSLRSVWQLRD